MFIYLLYIYYITIYKIYIYIFLDRVPWTWLSRSRHVARAKKHWRRGDQNKNDDNNRQVYFESAPRHLLLLAALTDLCQYKRG